MTFQAATSIELVPIGWVRSELDDIRAAPKQADEGAPEAWIELDPRYTAAAEGLAAGDEIVVVTWLHAARRDTQVTRPRDDPSRPEVGVFATRSPHRPNPLGLHATRIVRRDGARIRVAALEAIDGTPVLDIKPVLSERSAR